MFEDNFFLFDRLAVGFCVVLYLKNTVCYKRLTLSRLIKLVSEAGDIPVIPDHGNRQKRRALFGRYLFKCEEVRYQHFYFLKSTRDQILTS